MIPAVQFTSLTQSRPSTGEMRFNMDTSQFEIYNGSLWQVVATDNSLPIPSRWIKWFAWYPVRVNGKWTCFKTVYRKAKYGRPSLEYTYGTLFDVLKDA